ncbi:hypothetical protein VPH35_025574 [Triticum aestivum]
MEVAISAVTGELVSRFISFLMKKYHSSIHAKLEEKMEADARYITNSGMMMQPKKLSEAMYRGYHELDTLRYQTLQDGVGFNEVSNDSSTSCLYLPKRSRTTDTAMHLKSHTTLESLEIAIANMAEFIVLLGGCERMVRRPYDVYLYTDNFMFSRHAEKQKLLSFLLQHNDLTGGHALDILPIIGASATGKKTLVAHACGDDRVRTRFPSVLHLKDHFHSFVIRKGRGSKIIIISRLQRLARFGTVKPIFLIVLSYDELRYLFKTLAFGSVDPAEHPRLVQLADEFAKGLHGTHGSLLAANMFADVLRRKLDIQFWRCILHKGLRYVRRNLAMYGAHPSMLMEQGHPVDITDFALHPLSMTPYTVYASMKKESPSMTFGQLLSDPSLRPEQDFMLISWESRMPPHNSFACFVTSHAQVTLEGSAIPGRKRRGVPI